MSPGCLLALSSTAPFAFAISSLYSCLSAKDIARDGERNVAEIPTSRSLLLIPPLAKMDIRVTILKAKYSVH